MDDFNDAASYKSVSSTSSAGSIQSCKVVLRRENFDDVLKTGDSNRAIAHSTRARNSSQLTEENVAAHLNPARRQLRSASVASDGTGSAHSKVTRSTRLTASQNTPKKSSSSAVRPATPSRRSSRLVSENEKTVDTPAKTVAAKRSLRSNSVVSVDEASPTPIKRTRSSSRLAESQGTPKALKTQVSKIKTEPTTPRRASFHHNKSTIISDIIDEESSDDEKTNKDSPLDKTASEVLESVEEEEKQVVKPDNSMVVVSDEPNDDAGQQNVSVIEKSPTISSNVNDKSVEVENIEAANKDESILTVQTATLPTKQDLPNASQVNDSSSVLISINTTETAINDTPNGRHMADTSTIEPAEPMETSLIADIVQMKSPIEKALQVVDNSDAHGKNSFKTNDESNELDSMDVTSIVNEKVSSPPPNKSKKQQQQSPAIAQEVQVKIDTSSDSDSDDDEIPKCTNIDDTLSEILKCYKPKAKPTPNRRASGAFSAMNVTALIHDEEMLEENVTTPKNSKTSSKRNTLNNTAQSTGFNEMEVSALAADFVAADEKCDSTDTPQNTNGSNEKELVDTNVELPQSEILVSTDQRSLENTPGKVTLEPTKAKARKSATPKVAPPNVVVSIHTPKPATPTSIASPKKISTAEKSVSRLTGLAIPSICDSSSTFSDIAERLTPGCTESDVNQYIDNIYSHLTPSHSESNVNQSFDEIYSNLTPEVSKSINSNTKDENRDQVSEKSVVAADKITDNSIHSDKNDVSVVDKTQPDLDETTISSEEKFIAAPKSVRKSVQIMTPKMERNHSFEKRVDTPYPAGVAHETVHSPSEFENSGKKSRAGMYFHFYLYRNAAL